MKKLFFVLFAAVAMCSTAPAADLPVAEPMYRVQASIPFTWTGFYIGGHAGGDFFSKDWFLPLSANNVAAGCVVCPIGAGGHNATSWLAGGQVGFNYQIAWFVAGVEADASATRLQGSSAFALTPVAMTINSKTDSIGTAAARMGIAFDHTMFFVKGGAAWARDTYFTAIPAAPIFQSITETRWGWMIGVGLEWAFFDNWSVKFEYDHIEFRRGAETLVPVATGAFALDFGIEQSLDLVKFGLNYRFGPGPVVVARY